MQQQYVALISTAIFFAIAFGVVLLRRHREAPLRREVRAQSITFRTVVKAKMVDALGSESSFRQGMNLIVRADSFEISIGFAPLRVVMGSEYYFKAGETTIELRHVVPRMRGTKAQDWIIAKTRHSGRDLQISFANYNPVNGDILPAAWDALVRAGAIPIGPPPQGSFAHRGLFVNHCSIGQGNIAPQHHAPARPYEPVALIPPQHADRRLRAARRLITSSITLVKSLPLSPASRSTTSSPPIRGRIRASAHHP